MNEKNQLEIMDLDVRQDDKGRDFGIITFGGLIKSAKRITNNPAFAEKRIGKSVDGEIVPVKVKPYTFEDSDGNPVTSDIRNVVKLGSETVEAALASYRTGDGERFELADATTTEVVGETQDVSID